MTLLTESSKWQMSQHSRFLNKNRPHALTNKKRAELKPDQYTF